MKLPAQPYTLSGLIRGLKTNGDPTPEVLLSELMADPRGDGPQPPMKLGSRTALLPDAGLCRALGVADATTGGNLVLASVQRVAAAARPQLALDLAGVPRLEVRSTGPVTLPAWTPENTPGGWIGEGGTAGENQVNVQTANASPKSSYAFLDLSRQLQKALPLLEADVLTELGRAVRNVLELGFINGTGSQNQPLGLLNIPGTTKNSWAGATPTYAELIEQLKNYSENHGTISSARWLLNTDLLTRLLAAEASASTGVFRSEIANGRPSILGVPAIISEAMPDNRLLLIDPNSLRQVFWGSPAALVDPYTFDTSGTLRLLVFNDADLVSLYRPMVCIGEAA